MRRPVHDPSFVVTHRLPVDHAPDGYEIFKALLVLLDRDVHVLVEQRHDLRAGCVGRSEGVYPWVA